MGDETTLVVAGVTINTEDESIKSLRSLEDVQKLDIFSHIEDADEKLAAENELLEKLSGE